MTKVLPFSDGFRLATRCMDSSMKIWDIRNTKAAVHSIYNLENNHAGSKICLSPDEKYILTGTSYIRETESPGLLKIYDTVSFEEKVSLSIGDVGVTDIKWQKNINQIFLGLDNGSALALFDPSLSQKGVVQCVTKRAREYEPVEFKGEMIIKTPHALPLFRDPAYNK